MPEWARIYLFDAHFFFIATFEGIFLLFFVLQSYEDPWILKTILKLISSQLHLRFFGAAAAGWGGTTVTHAASADPWGRGTDDRSVRSPRKDRLWGDDSFAGKLLKRVLTDDDVDGEGRLIRAARVDRSVGSIIHAGGSLFHSRSSFQSMRWRVHTRLQDRPASSLLCLHPLVLISTSPSLS